MTEHVHVLIVTRRSARTTPSVRLLEGPGRQYRVAELSPYQRGSPAAAVAAPLAAALRPSSRQRMSAPRLPSAELEMSFTLS
jgi:hypothetical protein